MVSEIDQFVPITWEVLCKYSLKLLANLQRWQRITDVYFNITPTILTNVKPKFEDRLYYCQEVGSNFGNIISNVCIHFCFFIDFKRGGTYRYRLGMLCCGPPRNCKNVVKKEIFLNLCNCQNFVLQWLQPVLTLFVHQS